MDEPKSLFKREKTATALGPHWQQPAFVVGIAATAGQLSALALFLDAMPLDSGMAFIIIQPSVFDATPISCRMLAAHTEMPVHGVTHEMVVERNTVYLIPPHQEMIMAGSRLLSVEDSNRKDLGRLVNNFFHALAQDAGQRAMGVVLSAESDDTRAGVLAIEAVGGMVIHGDQVRKFVDRATGPPTGPVAKSSVDLLLSRSKIAERLLKHTRRQTQPPKSHRLPGNLLSITGSWRERSGGMPSEKTLAAANPEFSEVLNAATQVSICATDVDGMITLFNSGAENMLGYTSCEMVGKRTPEIMHLPSEVEKRGKELSAELGREVRGFEVFVTDAKEGRFERREWTYVRKDGRPLTVNLVVTAVKDGAGKITGFLGVAEDISDRKRSEEALRKSEERFNLAVAGSNDGLWDWDIRTNEVYYAPRFKELLGYGNEEFEDTFAAFETHLHPDDRQPTLAMVRRHLEDHTPYDVEYRLRTKCGEYRWFRARGQAVWDDAGRPVRMAGSLTDLTKRKHAEAALEQYAAEVQRANQTLRMAEAESRKAVVQRDRFLAMLSHELRNPLSVILNGVGVLEHQDADREFVAGARQAIRRQVHHMSRLLDDLLDVARITQGKIDFRKEVLDLNDVISEAAQAMQPAMDERRQRLSVMPAVGPVLVEGDPTRLLQIVENLLTNASKYTPAEGVVFLELKKGVTDCEVCVRDNGRGIDPVVLPEIFDMFFQSDNALDRSDGGMGVGLTLVRSLVEMQDGTVTAHSEGLGRGSQFVVRLPLTSNPTATLTEQPPVSEDAVMRVLLVEDNPDSRAMLQAILTLDGFQVEVAEDGQQGLDAILARRPDVALIDIGLPRLDGYEVARRVRQNRIGTKVRLVALTGYGQAKDRAAVFQAGFDEHLVKPINPQELVRLLRARKTSST